jgi:4-carboxymuconolactone decarboxylase
MTHIPAKTPRLPEIDVSRLTPDQKKAYDAIVSGPRGEVVGPLRVWLNSPTLADRAQALGQYARYDSVLPLQQSELAIIVTARIWSSGFEWAHHAPIAISAGISQADVDLISRAQCPRFSDPVLQAIFNFAVELHRDRQVSDQTFGAALAVLGQQGVVDLVGICGYYTLISMTINAFNVPDGSGPSLPVLDIEPAAFFRN